MEIDHDEIKTRIASLADDEQWRSELESQLRALWFMRDPGEAMANTLSVLLIILQYMRDNPAALTRPYVESMIALAFAGCGFDAQGCPIEQVKGKH